MSCGTGAGGVQLNAPPRRALAYLVRGSAVTLAVEGLTESAVLEFGGPEGFLWEMPAEYGAEAALWPLSAATVDQLLDDGVSHVRVVIGDRITYAGPVVQMSGWSGETQAHQVMARHVAGARGPAGASAYEVAVAAGYEGTEAEWLESLRGADAPPVDVSVLATKTELTDGLASVAAAATGSFLPLSGDHSSVFSAIDKLVADHPDARPGDWSAYDVGSGFTRTAYLFVKGVRLGGGMSGGWGSAAIGVMINDAITHYQTTWSSQKIEQAIAAGGSGGGSAIVAMLNTDTTADGAYDLTPALDPGIYALQGVLLETYSGGSPGQVTLTPYEDVALRWTSADNYGAESGVGYEFTVNTTGGWGVVVEFSGVIIAYMGYGPPFSLQGNGWLASGSYVRYEKIGDL